MFYLTSITSSVCCKKSQNDNEKRIPNDIEKPKSEATKGKWNPKHISSYSQTNRTQNYLVT